jgi:hypothetical protein
VGLGVAAVDGLAEEGLRQAVQEGFKVVGVRLPTIVKGLQRVRVGSNPVAIIKDRTG